MRRVERCGWGTGSVTRVGDRWRARMPLSHGRRSLGLFGTEREAHAALARELTAVEDRPAPVGADI